MKKIDLHTHTIATNSDNAFEYSPDSVKRYIEERGIDAIAITNHNVFDIRQFEAIANSVSCLVLPGVEINYVDGHLLLIASPEAVNDFATRCVQLQRAISDSTTYISASQLKEIFPELSQYLLIPHYEKKPSVSSKAISELAPDVFAGEVSSPKKFAYCKKNDSSLVPVYFSDTRFAKDMQTFSFRQTYIDIGEATYNAIRYALRDRTKVLLSPENGRSLFTANQDGLRLSTGLNIVLGERSSGKSFTLNSIETSFERVKYLKQFALVERSESDEAQRFGDMLRKDHSVLLQEYLSEFKDAVNEVSAVDVVGDEKRLEHFVSSLLSHAKEHEKQDAFSRATLFSESQFHIESLEGLQRLVESTLSLLETEEFRPLIEKRIAKILLRELFRDLAQELWSRKLLSMKQTVVNDLVTAVKTELALRTAVPSIADIDLYELAMNRRKRDSFRLLVQNLRRPTEILRRNIQSYVIVARRRPFNGALEMKQLSGKQAKFSDAFGKYDDPFAFLQGLKEISPVSPDEYYRFFCHVEYSVLNRYGLEASGGERSEFRLLQEIRDATQFDMLLLDEPESSFDNIFLHNDVNRLLKEIAQQMPVVVVTHNNTVGVSIAPDYIIHTRRIVKDGAASFKVYCGHPSDRTLVATDGEEVENLKAILDCCEAGQAAFSLRKAIYEAF